MAEQWCRAPVFRRGAWWLRYSRRCRQPAPADVSASCGGGGGGSGGGVHTRLNGSPGGGWTGRAVGSSGSAPAAQRVAVVPEHDHHPSPSSGRRQRVMGAGSLAPADGAPADGAQAEQPLGPTGPGYTPATGGDHRLQNRPARVRGRPGRRRAPVQFIHRAAPACLPACLPRDPDAAARLVAFLKNNRGQLKERACLDPLSARPRCSMRRRSVFDATQWVRRRQASGTIEARCSPSTSGPSAGGTRALRHAGRGLAIGVERQCRGGAAPYV